MKKSILLLTVIGFAVLAKAQSQDSLANAKAKSQDFHAFKFDIGFGYAQPSNGSGTQAGATFTLQPHVRFSNTFALGLRMEAAAIGYKNNTTQNFKVSALASGCLSGEIYLSNRGFRPFIGAGAGMFDQESFSGTSGNNNNNNNKNTNSNSNNNSGGGPTGRVINFGGYPVIGFEAGHFRMSVEYDVTGSGNNYAAAKIGTFFGGGRKRGH